MPSLAPTTRTGKITYLGRVIHRDTKEIAGEPIAEMPLTYAGFEDEFHAGLTRPSCSRVLAQYPKGTEIRNVRQLCICSAEEMAVIATALELDTLDPAWLGASIVVSGIPDFSHLPPSSRLQSENGTTLTIDMQNGPCQFPAMTIEQNMPGHGKGFKPAAEGKRGVTAWVEREGTLRVGDTLTLHVPSQRAWLAQPDLFEN